MNNVEKQLQIMSKNGSPVLWLVPFEVRALTTVELVKDRLFNVTGHCNNVVHSHQLEVS